MLPLRVFFTRRTVLRAGRRNGSIPFVRWPEDLACHMRGIAASAGNASLPLSSRTPIRCLPPAVLPLARQEGRFFRISPSRSACGAGERAVLLPVLALYRRAFDLPGKKLPSCQSVTGLVVSFVAVRRWRHILRWFTCCRCPVGGTGRSMYPAGRNFFRCSWSGQGLGACGCDHDCLRLVGKKGPQVKRTSDAERGRWFLGRRPFPDKTGGHTACILSDRREGRQRCA